MFGGFGSRFAKFGTGGGGRSIASAADLLQLFKRGSEDGAMLDELDNTTDLEFANVNALTGSTSYVTFNGESTDSSQTIVLETMINVGASVPDIDDLFGQSAGTGTGKSWARLRSTGAIQTFIGGSATTIAPSGSIQPNTTHKLQLCISPLQGEVTLFVDGIAGSTVLRTIDAADGDFQLKRGHTGTSTISDVTMGHSSLYKREDDVIDLIVLCGQSNAIGQCGQTAPSNLDFERIHRWAYQLGETTPNATNVNLENIDTRWGLELSMGDTIFNDDGRTVAVLKVAKGSTLLDGDWSPTQGMYEAFKTRYSAFESALTTDGYTIGKTTFVWVHGESDSNSESSANDYLTNFDAMMSGWESEVGFDPDVIYLTQTPLLSGAARTYQSVVDTAKETIAARGDNKLFTTRDLSIQADGTHYDALGLETLGKRLGEEWLKENSYNKRYIFNAPLQEGSGSTAYDVSGNGNHGTITSAAWTTADNIESWNHQHGFDIEASFNGSSNHIDLSSGFTLGTSWEIETALATSGSGNVDGRPFGMVESNNVFQFESGAGEEMKTFFRDSSGNQVANSMTPTDRSDFNTYKVVRDGNSLTYFINGSQVDTDDASSLGNIVIANPIIGARSGDTNFFSGSFKTWKLTIAGVVTVDYDFVINPDNGSYSKIRIPTLNTKTTQVATFDGVADRISTGFIIPNFFGTLTYTTRFKANTLHQGMLVSNRDANNFRFIDIQLEASGNITVKYQSGSQSFTSHSFVSAYSADTLYDLTYTIRKSDASGSISIQEVGGSINSLAFDFDNIPDGSFNDVRIGQENQSNNLEFNGEIHSAKLVVNGSTKFDYDFQSDIGTTTVQDLSTNNNNGTVTVGSGGTDSFWGTRVADTAGSLVSADYAAGNLTTSNPPALDNVAEADLVQTDSVFTSGTTSFWSADGSTQDEKTFAQLLDHAANRNGYDRIWVKVVDGKVICIAQYNLDKDFLPSDVLKNERYFGGTSGALRDVNGDLILDGSGFVIFAA